MFVLKIVSWLNFEKLQERNVGLLIRYLDLSIVSNTMFRGMTQGWNIPEIVTYCEINMRNHMI